MFRPRDPQSSLFTSALLLPDEKRLRLERDWPGEFRRSILPLIDEEIFRDLYCQDNGCPNKPAQILVATLVLKEFHDYTDMQALGALDYDLRWHMALDLEPGETHCCQKTLHNFRARLMRFDRARVLFCDMVEKIMALLGIDPSKQRLDSTHIISNIARLTRLGLLCETVRVFLKQLKGASKRKYREVPESLRSRYIKEDGAHSSYDDARSSESKRRIAVSARDVWRLLDRFRGDKRIMKLPAYALLERLMAEQCEIVKKRQEGVEGDADAGEGAVPVVVKEAKKVGSDSLQSPHDAAITYSGHKGKGIEVQIAETVDNGEKPEIITYSEVTRSCDSDENATVPAIDDLAEREIQPDELLADTNYGSTANVIELERRGTELVAPVAGHAPAAEENSAADETENASNGRPAAVHDSNLAESAPRPDDGREIEKGEFEIDVKGERCARCPTGQAAVDERRDAETGGVRLVFAASSCAACPLAERCPAKRRKDGTRVLRTTLHAAVLARRRRYQQTREFRKRYARRAGIEGTNSELKGVHGLGHLRVRGIKPIRLAVRFKTLACNVKRALNYLVERARATARAAAAALAGAGEAA
jgi:hypothetical protein